jgi:hypothetical protein
MLPNPGYPPMLPQNRCTAHKQLYSAWGLTQIRFSVAIMSRNDDNVLEMWRQMTDTH